MGPVVTSRADRERHVAQMLASSRLEGLEPDEAHQQLLQAYIEGSASLDDLLAHARAYACYRSRPADDGGTYYLSPRDDHLMPRPTTDPAEIEKIRADLTKLQLAYEAERDAERKPETPLAPEVAAMVEAFFRKLDQ